MTGRGARVGLRLTLVRRSILEALDGRLEGRYFAGPLRNQCWEMLDAGWLTHSKGIKGHTPKKEKAQ
jgi:hypothetical protein